MSTKKTQVVELVFEKNGQNWGMSSDIVRHTTHVPLPLNGFDAGVHLVGAKVMDSVYDTDGVTEGVTPTGWISQVANIITDKDVEGIVGAVLTIVDATIIDKDQRKAFKSLVKQAIYNRYNQVTQKSAQMVGERGYQIGILPDGVIETETKH